jgi:hypothetical protein
MQGQIRMTIPRGASGGGDVSVHNDLTGRSANNAHPISAITGLQTELNTINNDIDGLRTDVDDHEDRIDALEQGGGGMPEPNDDGKLYGRSRAIDATTGTWEEIEEVDISNKIDTLTAGSSNVSITGTGTSRTITVTADLTNRFTSTQSPTGVIGTVVDDLDLTLVTPIDGGTDLAVRDIVIFANNIHGEVIEIRDAEDEYDIVIISVQTAVTWGSITGDITSQTDLNTALNDLQTALDEEIQDRIDGDQDLQDEIDDINEFLFGDVTPITGNFKGYITPIGLIPVTQAPQILDPTVTPQINEEWWTIPIANIPPNNFPMTNEAPNRHYTYDGVTPPTGWRPDTPLTISYTPQVGDMWKMWSMTQNRFIMNWFDGTQFLEGTPVASSGWVDKIETALTGSYVKEVTVDTSGTMTNLNVGKRDPLSGANTNELKPLPLPSNLPDLITPQTNPTNKLVDYNLMDSAIQSIINSVSVGLRPPVEIDLESDLPIEAGLTSADVGLFYIIQDMDVSMAGRTGKAWANYKDGNVNNPVVWYKVYDQYYSADGTTITLTPTGQLQVAQALIQRITTNENDIDVLQNAVINVETDRHTHANKTFLDGLSQSTLDAKMNSNTPVVRFDAQSLSSTQQAQARQNLGVSTATVPLLYSPHTWSFGFEHNLGDGTFGMRLSGHIVSPANVAINTTLLTAQPGTWMIVDYGGFWFIGTAARASANGVLWTSGGTSILAAASIYMGTTNNMLFSTMSGNARSGGVNNSFDIWVRYRKG